MKTEARDLGAEAGTTAFQRLEINAIPPALETSSGPGASRATALDRRTRNFGQEWFVVREGICFARLCIEQTPAREQAAEARRHPVCDSCDFGIVGCREWHEAHCTGARIRAIHTI